MVEKSVLFIAYNFPPSGGPSVQRSLKFIKYLPREGWNPIVLTASENSYPILDPSLATDIPHDTLVYRVKSWDINYLQRKFRQFHLGKVHAFINTVLCLPDSAIFWSKFSHPVIKDIVDTYHPEILYSSSGPYSSHLLALWIKEKYKLPWVADFRDPWSQNRIIRYPPGYRWVNRQMERKVLNVADEIIAVSSPVADGLNLLLQPKQRRINVIPNGYDPEDIIPSDPIPTSKFTITHTGKFTRVRRPKAFLQAISELVENGYIPAEEIEVNFAGSNLDAYIPNHPPFIKLGYIPHREINSLLMRSSILLLVQDPSPESIGDYSAKVFEYLASNRPILAITSPKTVAAQLIIKSNSGNVVEHNSDQIKEALYKYYQGWKKGIIVHQPDWSMIKSFSRVELTKQLSSIFEKLT